MGIQGWSLAIQLVAICAAAAIGTTWRARTAVPLAIVAGLTANIVAQVLFAGGGPGACVGFVLLPGYCVGAALGGAALSRFVRRTRYCPGRCDRCGYDLTGNVSGVCPECGKPVDDGVRASGSGGRRPDRDRS